MSTRIIVVLALLVAPGCAGGTDGETPITIPGDSLVAYTTAVHPIMEVRCGTLDCHGDPGRPLRLFAETGLRLRDDLRNLTITVDELAANADSLRGVDPTVAPASSLVMTKALGLVGHEGGVIWNAGDPQAICVLGWLSGTSGDPTVSAACATAQPQVALPPP